LGLQFEESLSKNVSKTLISTDKLGMVVHICGPSYMGGLGRRIIPKPGWSKKHKTLSEKITKAK
jgi:hypothetical protein